MRETFLVFGIIVLVSTTVSVQDNQGESNTLTPTEAAEGWELLFDGQTTNEWRGFTQTTMPAGWQAVDGALTRSDLEDELGVGPDVLDQQREFGEVEGRVWPAPGFRWGGGGHSTSLLEGKVVIWALLSTDLQCT